MASSQEGAKALGAAEREQNNHWLSGLWWSLKRRVARPGGMRPGCEAVSWICFSCVMADTHFSLYFSLFTAAEFFRQRSDTPWRATMLGWFREESRLAAVLFDEIGWETITRVGVLGG